MRFLPHAHRISLLSPAPVSHIFHSCRPSMPRKQKAALVPTPIKQSHEAMVVSYRPQTLHDTIHTVLPSEVLPAIPSYLEFITVRLFVFQLTASRRGWRRFRFYRHLCSNISTHSLSKRLTGSWRKHSGTFLYFNSQPHEEADWTEWQPIRTTFHFNSQPLEEADGSFFSSPSFCIYFNSQPHEEADRRGADRILWAAYFNSQPLEEADDSFSLSSVQCDISTHSLSKRLTILLELYWWNLYYFNSQPHEEADRLLKWYPTRSSHFNSQPHEEADNSAIWVISILRVFQLTASRRGWPSVTNLCICKCSFQLTASRRGWQFQVEV